jgi:glutaredoxin
MDEMIKKANGKRTIPQIFFWWWAHWWIWWNKSARKRK